jgi:nitrate/nitrite transport system permease protein
MKSRTIQLLYFTGLTWAVPFVRLFTGEDIKVQLIQIWKLIGLPSIAIFTFLLFWHITAQQVHTSLGTLPGPVEVSHQTKILWKEHLAERQKAKAFYARHAARTASIKAANPDADVKRIAYTGKPTYIDQILTSLKTVFVGFLFASFLALPIGVLCGANKNIMTALNPIIQVLKPVSPLAWLPIVTMVVSAVYATNSGPLSKSFIISAITVAMCSLWATLINTAVGVASVNKDYLNVAQVLQLSPQKRIFKVILPATLPMIFTGLRITLGVGWMVLIAAEMMAQNPGLGKFIWDEFQNGSSASMARIMVAVFTIGIIGYTLDQLMVSLQKLVAFE